MSKTKVSETFTSDGTLHYKNDEKLIVLVPEGFMLYTKLWKGKGSEASWELGDLIRVHHRRLGSEIEVVAMENLTPNLDSSETEDEDE